MTVYADVLVVLNLIVDYFLLRLTAIILKRQASVWRILAGAFVGALTSLYIFLPQMKAFIEIVLRIVSCLLICFLTFGFKGTKAYFRGVLCFFAVTFIYGGAMTAVWYFFKPSGMIINNSVVYFNISPIFLIAFSVGAYIIITVLNFVLAKNCVYSENCLIEIRAKNNLTLLSAIVDTGNSIEDMFSKSEIIIVDEAVMVELFPDYPASEELKSRYRALPCDTVSGVGLLDGYRCDRAILKYKDKEIKLDKPVLAVSKARLNDGYNAIINPKALNLE